MTKTSNRGSGTSRFDLLVVLFLLLPFPASAEDAESSARAQELINSMSRAVRFRNLLVHEYARIEPELVVRILRENLDDFDAFRRAASAWM